MRGSPSRPLRPVGSTAAPATVLSPSASSLVAALLALAWLLSGAPELLRAQACNPISCENQLPGNPPSDWDISGAGDDTVQGFATDISVNVGQTIGFKIKTDAADYKLDIYRMGYYSGMGARKVATISPSATLPQVQPACLSDIDDRPRRLWQLGGCRPRGTFRPRPCPASTSRRSFARIPEAPATLSSSCAMTAANRTCCSRPLTRPGRHTTSTAGTASMWARPRAAPTRSVTTARSPRGRPRRKTGSSTPSIRWFAGSRPTATTSATSRASTRPAWRPEYPRSPGLPLGRTRRVLVGCAASQRRSGAGCRRPSRLLQRQRGLLEDTLGEQHLHARHDLQDACFLQGDARERQYRSLTGMDRYLARSALQPARLKAGARRTRSPERSSW